MGAVAFGNGILASTKIPYMGSPAGTGKKLIATTDYFDNIIGSKFLFGRKHLDALHKYLASIGVTRHQWIVEMIWNFYDPQPNGFDLLAEAVKSAHKHGLEFYAELKPFEGGSFGNALPHSMPFAKETYSLRDIRGIYPSARPFVAENPHLCLKRRPGTYEATGPVSAIRLVKNDDKPTRIKPEHLSIWTSQQNNGFVKYNGPVSFRESVEWRPVFPKSKECRIIHLEGLQLPANHKYILIRCDKADPGGNFTNERGSIVELTSSDGNMIPSILSMGTVNYDDLRQEYENNLYEKITRYFQNPEVREEFTNREKAEKHYCDFYSFDERIQITAPYTLDKEGYVAVACGKPEYMLGNLHPIYPEVRKHWLDMISFCLERGVDGINIRHSNHTRSPEDWEYGFNDAVIEAAGGRTDYPTIRRINGNAYTQFLREARELVKSWNKTFVIHLYSQMLMPDDRSGRTNYIPPNFEWQWKTWIREIADELEFRGAWMLRPENLRQVLETFAVETSDANKPFYFQGNMKELGLNGPYEYKFTRNELEMVQNNPAYSGFVLYETANFTRVKENADLEESPDLEKLLKNYKWETR
ncbi:MAG: hypothetical protein A2W90_23795 [Bacteroidetes bacterium GWF2_42_66]|nr:MAG: hypothetical protein A2W92_16475 [Bacteroidetes bacterium GWA2_42_15]OFY00289.1 MAG: hypothetical protein A2W89_13870 [Bacteroidetes bacterium GWE2_42_39]OFY47140.1 MAG: hypothetical protein A2W90_23795 [Bacteroidetes bacterium GWF2_42_66]HAZ02169.1 hypothetical protein [Marinilabiliales bacterium]HBL76677.1 hypothetical protein [Prolixibacteraceae bacterium]